MRKIRPEEIVTFNGRMGQGMCLRLAQICSRRKVKRLLKEVKVDDKQTRT